MWAELGISSGTGIIVLVVLYFIIKWAVRNGIKEAYEGIIGKETAESLRMKELLKEYGHTTDGTEVSDAFFPK